jgi:hypothetical protein
MEPFHFLTLWHFDAPVERVWEELNRPQEFPNWWPGVEYAEVLTDGPPGVIGFEATSTLSSTSSCASWSTSRRPI